MTSLKSTEEKRYLVVSNVKSIIFYSLAMTIALSFNDLMTTIFDSFPNTRHILGKTVYVMILFAITILSAYYVGQTVIN
jgi:hypothetical protein